MGLVTDRLERFRQLCEEQQEHLDQCAGCGATVGFLCPVVHRQLDGFAKLIREFTDDEYRAAFGTERRG